MAEHLSLEELRQNLLSRQPLSDQFAILRAASFHTTFATDGIEEHQARDIVIRLLDRREEFNGYREVVDSLALAVGLYPYASTETLSTSELLEYEAHRPEGMADIVFHRVQAAVYNYLMDGESVILTAPTSFGKSLIIDGLLASESFDNVAIVVPTIALIDETRRRLSEQFRERYKLVTHPSQAFGLRNILVMTQERILDVAELPQLDLFVVDEFYKLDPSGDADRANLLNQAFYRLRATGAQFYLLGPTVGELPLQLDEMARVIKTDFSTVALDVQKVESKGSEDVEALVRLCRTLDEPTLIFCKSPRQARDVAISMIDAGVGVSEDMQSEAHWIGNEYHPDWSFVRAVRQGIGIHHGRIPRSLGQLAVRSFNEGRLNFLICTSTLIEGVNTTAKNVVIYDNKIARRRFDYFTFNNIKGRSGRMFNHFVGHVYLFYEPPDDPLRDIDVPILTQPEDAAPSLLIQLEESEMTERALEILDDVLHQDELPLEDLRENSGVDPAAMIAVAQKIRSSPELRSILNWQGFPNWDELETSCRVLWEDLGGSSASVSYVRSYRQLAFRLRKLSSAGIAGLIELELDESGDPDQAVEDVLEFVRQWAGFHFPRLLMVLERVYNRVVDSLGGRRASYAFYATQVESLFLPRSLVALEEYGLPTQIGEQIHEAVDLDVSLDEALEKLRSVDAQRLHLSEFEAKLLSDVQSHI